MAVQVYPLDRILNLTILQLGPLSWSTGADKAPLQVGADIRQPGSTIDPRVHIPEMATFVSLLPRLSQIVYTLCLRIRTCDRIRRYLQAI